MSELSLSQIRERYHSFLAEGVVFFPTPSFAEQTINSHLNPLEKIRSCGLCPLSQTRHRVVSELSTETKKYFFLCGFPSKIEENEDSVYSYQAKTKVILNLVEKLEILPSSYFSFCQKCVPDKSPPEKYTNLCVINNLSLELKEISPEYIFAFGPRAHMALGLLAHYFNGEIKPSSQEESHTLTMFGKSFKVFLFPSEGELEEYPQWRHGVWASLKDFKTKNC